MIDEKEIKTLRKYQFWKEVFEQDKLESRDKDNCTARNSYIAGCSGCGGGGGGGGGGGCGGCNSCSSPGQGLM